MKFIKLALITISAFSLLACGSSEKKSEAPAYFYAKEGRPLAAIAPKGIKMPDLSGALVIPTVSQPLSEYNPKLIEPPLVIETEAEPSESENK